jgi:hypothetical protein
MITPFKTDEEIQAVVNGFEQCTTGKTEFTHSSHLTIATFYLSTLCPEQAFEKMRAGLLRFLNHHDVPIAKYSDEITLAWLNRIQDGLANQELHASLVTVTNAVIEQLGDAQIERK